MSAYWIGRAQQKDEAGYQEYGRLRQIAYDRYADTYPNEALLRKGSYRVLEGPDDFNRYVILKFPSMEHAVGFYNSPEYQAAAAVRRAASGRCELVIASGIAEK